MTVQKRYATAPFVTVLMVVISMSLAACGSTKVYTADKTMVHNGTMYNPFMYSQITEDWWFWAED